MVKATLFTPAWDDHKWSLTLFFLLLLLFLFIYFWLHWVFVVVRGLSLVAVSGGYSSLRCVGFSLRWLLLLQSTGSRRAGFSSCGSRALERRFSSCSTRALLLRGMWESSQTRAQTRAPYTGRRILNHCATREARSLTLYASSFKITASRIRVEIKYKMLQKWYRLLLQNHLQPFIV